jgi:tetratricopeptide (TPR) repeat protein
MNPRQSAQLEHHLREMNAAMRAGNAAAATDVAERAIALGLEHPHFLTFAAYRRLEGGGYDSALALATRALELAPRNVDGLNAKGACLVGLGRTGEAVRVFEAALAEAPDDAALRFSLAAALEGMGELTRASDEFERVFALDPNHAEAAARAAFLFANRGEMARARRLGLAALALDRRQAFASFAVALADIEAGQFEDARLRLTETMAIPQIGRVVRALAESMLGDALDAMGSWHDAFTAYAHAGDVMRELYAPPQGSATALTRVRRIADFVAGASRESWSAPAEPHGPCHVFLVGFPRSGTTLAAHVLAAHRGVILLDEKPTLADSLPLTESEEGLSRIAQLEGAELDALRNAYWARAAEYGFTRSARTLVDKMPLNCEVLCLVSKLFPDARILFAVRDPRDVAFSCFRRRFGMTRQMYELLTLESTAVYYDAVMTLSELYRDRLQLPRLDLRHEDLVHDFEREARRLCAFLGLEYDTGVASFAEIAHSRNISTPSAAQVLRGLNDDGVGQWRPYESEMQGVMPLLAPWIARFGYGA